LLPLHDDNPTRRFAFVTFGIIVLNILAFLLWEPTFGSSQRQEVFLFCHAEVPWEVTHQVNLAQGGVPARDSIARQFEVSIDGARSFQDFLAEHCPHKSWWEAVFVSMFLHGGWLHIGGNMLFLWVFGNNVEDKLGRLGYLLFYLAAGVVASLAQLAASPQAVVPNLGASGAIAGVLGAYLLMFPRRRILTLIIFFVITAIYLPAFVVLGLWFVYQLFNGVGSLSSRVSAGTGVAFWAHIGGFSFGAILAALFFPKERFRATPSPPRPDVWGRRRSGWGWRRRSRRPDTYEG
jgi:membrane associated rhomboid family serine protease